MLGPSSSLLCGSLKSCRELEVRQPGSYDMYIFTLGTVLLGTSEDTVK